MSQLLKAKVTTHRQISSGYYLLEFSGAELAETARPGQFVHVKCSRTTDPLLRRPVSIHDVNKDRGTVRLLYRVAGRGTELLSVKEPGERLDVMGPLGNGFQLPDPGEKVAVVAGGIGVAPLFFLLRQVAAAGNDVKVFVGARSCRDLLAVDDIKGLGVEIQLATDDGSAGHRGPVTELLARGLKNIDRIYTCGPAAMMKAVAGLAREYNIPTQVSLEERMGCGVGACLACTCKIKTPGGSSYKRVCADGPVFNAQEVAWE
ncbi:dihydroorotate dehydrogenase electron transfer subunit [Desulfohalotomaculum tongense]|uniref:dihydroorotate dehydrogenase electron transfer subunit n=1 Tax=Desulforadius tongensis TaxID=1216062 RepID=UPI001957F127|nr:dihydroorotate dehydrogenase electron transfer subunit [Desulforadius tongensis]MBM7855142.1 dihydroorotate dehydrogenase electron transfer subunit [Desulforadius tongensis]